MSPRHPCIEQIAIAIDEGVDILDKNIDFGGLLQLWRWEKELAMKHFQDWWEKKVGEYLK